MNSATQLDAMHRELKEVAASPADAPRGLRGRFYTDDAYFSHECATVLRQNWHCVGRSDELPALNDYLTLYLLDEPIIVARGENGIAAHRGI